jgi:ppGpp synthetase/RelA/SpoT-type nucleotidyltranferase
MPWIAVEPKHTRGEVDRAGDVIIDPTAELFQYHEALQVVNNWRAAHSWPLNIFQTTLRNRAKKVDDRALIAQRLKRLASIETKLKRFPSMKLARMQDLGGCRAVLKNIRRVYDLVGVYDEAESKNTKRHDFVKKFDYIVRPKATAASIWSTSTELPQSSIGCLMISGLKFKYARSFNTPGRRLSKR